MLEPRRFVFFRVEARAKRGFYGHAAQGAGITRLRVVDLLLAPPPDQVDESVICPKYGVVRRRAGVYKIAANEAMHTVVWGPFKLSVVVRWSSKSFIARIECNPRDFAPRVARTARVFVSIRSEEERQI